MYVKIVDNSIDQFPYTIGQLKRDNPNVSFPKVVSEEALASYGVYRVTYSDEPVHNARTQYCTLSDEPSLVDGNWVKVWTVHDKTADQIADYDSNMADGNRFARNNKLSSSDWTQLADSPLSTESKAAWATYRQSLRDLSSHANWPNLEDSDWPTEPA